MHVGCVMGSGERVCVVKRGVLRNMTDIDGRECKVVLYGGKEICTNIGL